jgi:uncharacterized phage protein gp47/JayE
MFKQRTIEEIQSEFLGSLTQAAPNLNINQSSPLYTLARANASVISDQEQRLSAFLKSSNVLSAEADDLDLLASSIVVREEPTTAIGTVLINPTAEEQTIPLGIVLTDLLTGLQFISTTSATTSRFVSVSLSLKAASSGSAYNIAAGTVLFSPDYQSVVFTVGTAKLANNTYTGSMQGGRDIEPDDYFRQRLLASLLSSNQTASKNFLRQKLLSYPGVTRAYVKTRVGGVIEVWVNTIDGFNSTELEAIKDYLLQTVPAGIILTVGQFRIKTFDLSLRVTPFNSSLANLSLLTQQISFVVNNYVSSLDIADNLTLSKIDQLVRPLVQNLKVLSPVSDLKADIDQVLLLSSLDISYPGLL